MKDGDSASGANSLSAEEGKTVDDALTKKIVDVRSKIHSTFGQVVLAMCVVDRYRHMMLQDLQQLVIDPLIKDRIVLAFPVSPEKDAKAAAAPATIAIWASVSEAVDKRIREQIQSGVFPIRLKGEDWTSGEIVWLLDVIAPNEAMATEVLKSFRLVAKRNEISIHPVVSRLVSQDTLRKLSRKQGAERDDASTLQ